MAAPARSGTGDALQSGIPELAGAQGAFGSDKTGTGLALHPPRRSRLSAVGETERPLTRLDVPISEKNICQSGDI